MEKKEKTVKEKKTTRSLPLSGSNATSAVVDVSSIHSHLQKLIPEVEKKKTKDMSNWSYLRPYMSFDFVDDNSSVRPPPISVIPWQSQENILLDDLLSVLEGFQGKYIVAQRVTSSYSPRTFIVADSIEPTLRHLVQQILPLASDHSIVIRFIQEKRQLKWGRVNQALASAMNSFISDYTVFIAQLESLLRKNQLTLQNIWFYLQSTIQTFQVLAKIANSINESEAIGGQTLTILHEETMHYITDNNAQKLCMFLIGEASIPYFESLQRWLHKGIVFDPYMEFLIMDNVEEEADANKVTGLYSDSYWSKRYTICNKNVPVFLNVVQEIILRTGRYLNVVRQCSETTRSSADFAVPPVEKLVYTLHGEQYLPIIEKAYQFASSTLLDLLLTKYDIINRIKSLKRYFLMEQGDFIVQLLDLCEEELVKPISEVVPSRLQSLFELALRTSTGKHDPYKEDVTLTILTENNTYQIFTIHSICNENKQFMSSDEQFQAKSKTGLEGFAFQVVSKWPLSLLFDQKIMGCYQMLFRHLVNCKHVDRRLCRVWINDKEVKRLPTTAASGYLGAFSLRQRMLFCVQNLEYYMMEEAIEPNWIRFMSRLNNVNNIDDLLAEHWDFVDQCMKDCMFMNHDLIAIINKILASCIEFCDFMQSIDGVDSKASENQSFEDNIKRLDTKFTSYLITLLTTISSLGQEESVEKLRNILYRENFNGFYTEKIERDQRGNDTVTSSISG
ncbi:gamma-tubulin complex component 2-like isoform X2 [Homalodisca vitripennis]|uniref:gamma-tubulin complex component 2-like isoform X2 n=1 Tax=Homalodisca vitripennis TaxID=197043 RepID=UPI001EECDC5E|nr:gamma-tubulin complex component 2-like isoform X2 [Homalodisca vitripennis]